MSIPAQKSCPAPRINTTRTFSSVLVFFECIEQRREHFAVQSVPLLGTIQRDAGNARG